MSRIKQMIKDFNNRPYAKEQNNIIIFKTLGVASGNQGEDFGRDARIEKLGQKPVNKERVRG